MNENREKSLLEIAEEAEKQHAMINREIVDCDENPALDELNQDLKKYDMTEETNNSWVRFVIVGAAIICGIVAIYIANQSGIFDEIMNKDKSKVVGAEVQQ